jgi:hypothetical protein
MVGKSLTKVIILLLFLSSAFGGIRGPGKYSGVVIYDQWDTCYIYAGPYLMYITDKKKEKLRKYEGTAVIVDAKEVFQPINPGDGLITEFEVDQKLSEFPELKLTATPEFETKKGITFELEIENLSGKTIVFETSDIAPTLFGEKGPDDLFSPSDGRSMAHITRCNLDSARQWISIKSFTVTNAEGETVSSKTFSISTNTDASSLQHFLKLNAGEKQRFSILLDIPSGKYDFLFGYNKGVHEGITLVSNKVSFSVSENGKASVTIPIPAERTPVGIRDPYAANPFLNGSDRTNIFNFQFDENNN